MRTRLESRTVAYVISCLVGSLVCLAGLLLNLRPTSMRLDGVVLSIMVFIILNIVVLIGALLPFVWVRWLLRKLMNDLAADVLAGGIIGGIFGPLLFCGPGLSTTGIPDLPFWVAYRVALAHVAVVFLVGGMCGGLTFWTSLRRFPPVAS